MRDLNSEERNMGKKSFAGEGDNAEQRNLRSERQRPQPLNPVQTTLPACVDQLCDLGVAVG